MILEFDRSFSKSLNRIKERNILSKIEKVILSIEQASSIEQLKNNKKLIGFQSYYRIKIGDDRLGYESIDGKTIRLITIAHRKDIYRKFP